MIQSGKYTEAYIRLLASFSIMFTDLFDWFYPQQRVKGTNEHMRRVLSQIGNVPRPRLTCPK